MDEQNIRRVTTTNLYHQNESDSLDSVSWVWLYWVSLTRQVCEVRENAWSIQTHTWHRNTQTRQISLRPLRRNHSDPWQQWSTISLGTEQALNIDCSILICFFFVCVSHFPKDFTLWRSVQSYFLLDINKSFHFRGNIITHWAKAQTRRADSNCPQWYQSFVVVFCVCIFHFKWNLWNNPTALNFCFSNNSLCNLGPNWHTWTESIPFPPLYL